MARKITIHEMDELTFALGRILSCSFLLELIEEENVVLPGSRFDRSIVAESRHAVMDWQLDELQKVYRVIDNLEWLKEEKKGGDVISENDTLEAG